MTSKQTLTENTMCDTTHDDEIPEEFICPITQDIFFDPVQDLNNPNRTYERCAILAWLASKGTDPFTRKDMKARDLIPNVLMRTKVRLWQKQTGREVVPKNSSNDNNGFYGYCSLTNSEAINSRSIEQELGIELDDRLARLLVEYVYIERYYDEQYGDRRRHHRHHYQVDANRDTGSPNQSNSQTSSRTASDSSRRAVSTENGSSSRRMRLFGRRRE